MEFISSDTNVWIDFRVISRINLPFLLPFTYIMYAESMASELLTPVGFHEELVNAGLVGVEITYDEFTLADSWGSIYPRLSVPDRIALAIAKKRNIVLLTGDGALRKAAMRENVSVLGTIGILDKLFEGNYIQQEEYQYCLSELMKHNGAEVRLPSAELRKRLENLSQLSPY